MVTGIENPLFEIKTGAALGVGVALIVTKMAHTKMDVRWWWLRGLGKTRTPNPHKKELSSFFP